MPIKAVIWCTNPRNLDHWMPLFQRIQRAGGQCSICAMPFTGDPSWSTLDGGGLPVAHYEPIAALRSSALTLERLREILSRLCEPDVDAVFLCDVQSYPSNAIYRALATLSLGTVVFGLQHGLFQSWWLYNQHVTCDHLLCFGERHRQELVPELRARSTAVGLPHLDRLETLSQVSPVEGAGYILYLAQRTPEESALRALFKALEAKMGLPVVIRSHPQYPLFPRHDRSLVCPAVDGRPVDDLDLVGQIQNANFVMTSHSTAGLDALYLRRPLVLVPNHGLTAWAGYPAVAMNFSYGQTNLALQRAQTYNREIDLFLDWTVGGRRFDHSSRALTAVQSVLAMRKAIKRQAPSV